MGVTITKKPDFARMKEQLRAEVVKEMGKLALDEKEEVVTRTGKGIDFRGSAFVRYTSAYAKRKSAAGRNVSRPDLRFSGRILQSFQIQVVQKGTKIIARIFPGSNLEALKVRGNMRFREFFAISDKSRKSFHDRMTNVFRRLK